MNVEITLNKIFIIESLPNHELQTGSNLYDQVKYILLRRDIITSQLIVIDSKVNFIKFFENLKSEIINNKVIPWLHFEIHGNKNGFHLKSGEEFTWLDLHQIFIELNIIVRNRIWISLATCYGAEIFSIIKPSDRAPFYGFIGNWDIIYNVNIEISFTNFFKSFLPELDILDGIRELNRENSGIENYRIYTSQYVFERIYKTYEDKYYSPKEFKKRVYLVVQSAIKELKKNEKAYDISKLKKNAINYLIQERENIKDNWRIRFYMIDLFPENEERFLQDLS